MNPLPFCIVSVYKKDKPFQLLSICSTLVFVKHWNVKQFKKRTRSSKSPPSKLQPNSQFSHFNRTSIKNHPLRKPRFIYKDFDEATSVNQLRRQSSKRYLSIIDQLRRHSIPPAGTGSQSRSKEMFLGGSFLVKRYTRFNLNIPIIGIITSRLL